MKRRIDIIMDKVSEKVAEIENNNKESKFVIFIPYLKLLVVYCIRCAK